MTRTVAVIFAEGPVKEPVHMELTECEYLELAMCKTTGFRFIQLEKVHHNIDNIISFWDVNEVNDDIG